ncbi:hypothetical protein [Hydrogenophaga defluvii]|uniref:Uncharacterized protein n=1 Tax=Hydrogenophaga defluvii TaxID=249410 RepID=A0ABW2SFK2_9BURK
MLIDQTNNALPIWVVYDNPVDFPGRFVARKWLNDTPTAETLQSSTLEELRSRLPPGLYRLERADSDDAKIVETWI